MVWTAGEFVGPDSQSCVPSSIVHSIWAVLFGPLQEPDVRLDEPQDERSGCDIL